MTKKTFSLVTTTINIPHLLKKYALDARQFERTIEQFIVVGDKKTPPEVAEFCKNLEKDFSFPCRYLSPNDQNDYLKRWPAFKEFLPWNCIQRRNVGFLYAYFEGKADVIVTIDDDNLLYQEDYFGCHGFVGERQNISAIRTESGWWNVCEMLEEARGIPFYHRGYPLSQRWKEQEDKKTMKSINGRVIVNAGLWIDDPDVDALARLYFSVKSVKRNSRFPEKMACDIGTWSPFNSQNTALFREIIPAYFLFPFIGRYDDIWASYVIRHISDAIGDFVAYGSPVVFQKRNPHDYFKDFDAERFGMEYNDIFLEALRLCILTATTYRGAFAEIARQFSKSITRVCGIYAKNPTIFDSVNEGLQIWKEVFQNA